MLEISPRKIILQTFQRRYNIRLANQSQRPIIFKVRSTNTAFFTVEPNAGFLRPGTNLSLLMTVKARQPFNQKIQISHAFVTNVNSSFEQTWSHQEQQQHNIVNEIIYVSLKNQNEEQSQSLTDKEQRVLLTVPKNSHKKSKINFNTDHRYSNLNYTASKRGISFQGLPIIKQDQQFKDLIATSSYINSQFQMEKMLDHFQKQKRRHFDAEEREQLIFQLEQIRQKLKKEETRSARMKQQLEITEQNLKKTNIQGFKFQLGQSIGVICEQHHTTFTGLTLYILAAFIFGYALATITN